jgi:glutaconyl-CoA/methylmalonyl-CoA decarboxylase subunit gamma
MKYFVTIDGGQHEVEVTVRPNGELAVSLAGQSVDNDVVVLDDGSLSIRIDGKIIDLTIEGTPPDVGVIASGHRAYVRVESERHRAAAAAKRGGTAGAEKIILAPMPGRVVKILVSAGEEVRQGQGVAVIEAMKMENELRAKGAGTVSHVHVKPGDTIESGAKLISLA